MAATAPYIGSKISLISNSLIRYEGVLYSINSAESTIALQSVRCYGTEGRKVPEIPPSNEIYDFIMFRGQDIKDLTVLESANALPINDPAIMSVNKPPAGYQPAASDGKGAGKSGGPARGFGSKGGYKGDSGGDYGGGKGGGWGGWEDRGKSGWGKGSDRGFAGGWKGHKGDFAAKGWKGEASKGDAKGKGKGKDWDAKGAGKGGKAAAKGASKGGGGKSSPKGGSADHLEGKGHASTGRSGPRGESRRGGGGGGTTGELAPQADAKVKTEFAEDFDYASSNNKFEKVASGDPGDLTEESDKRPKPLAGYDKGKSFFDSISCQATERAGEAERQKVDRDKARKSDREAFGDSAGAAGRSPGERRGKGSRRGGRNRGSGG